MKTYELHIGELFITAKNREEAEQKYIDIISDPDKCIGILQEYYIKNDDNE